MTAEDKTRFITEEIERSGFPFEMRVASILTENKWKVLPSSPYLDEDEGQWREIDLKACKSTDRTQDGRGIMPYSVSIGLIIECKKTDKFAWVFFSWPREASDMELPRVNCLDFLTLTKRQSLLMDEISKGRLPPHTELQRLNLDLDLLTSYHAMVTPEVARKIKFFSELEILTPKTFGFLAAREKALTYKEIKVGKAKGGSGPHEIFEAMNTLIKATKHDMKLQSHPVYASAQLAKDGLSKGRFQIVIFLPILVFGGELYKWLDGNVSEVDEVLLEGRCHSERYFENMLIGVVTENHLTSFLSRIDEDYVNLANRVWENRDKLDEQLKAILDSPYFNGHPSKRGLL